MVMDYRSIHGQDISSFDLPSTHRLPTVSAAAALEELTTDPSRFASTGLDALDRALNPAVEDGAQRAAAQPGGFQKGQVIEVWGPPGSGKTNLGLQLASDALSNGSKVVWVDAFRPVCGRRLHDILNGTEAASTPAGAILSKDEQAANFLHFTCPSLAHFIALLCRPTASCLPDAASLVVIDSLSALVNQTFPKVHESRNTFKGATGPSASSRRLQVIQSMISSLQKLAATRDVIIVILSQCATRMQAEHGATLVPAIGANAWEQGIATRLVLFRDWSFKDGKPSSVYFAKIQKLNGKPQPENTGSVFAFGVRQEGLVPIEYDGSQPSLTLSSTRHAKRKLGDTDFEVADSEDEDYGWEDEDAAQIPTIPQWQGSEDLLLGQHDDEGNRKDEASDHQSVQSDEQSDRPRPGRRSSHVPDSGDDDDDDGDVDNENQSN